MLAYTHPMNLKIHQQDHSGARPFQCETCGRCFRTANRLKLHKATHSGDVIVVHMSFYLTNNGLMNR